MKAASEYGILEARSTEKRSRSFRILPDASRQYGGPLSFSKRLSAFLEERGLRQAASIDRNLDVLIVMVKAPLRTLLRTKLLGIPIILRLDGLYYPKKSGWINKEYIRVNLVVFLIRLFLCDFIVYQSEYSRRMCHRLLGGSPKPWRIIYNSVDRRTLIRGGRPSSHPELNEIRLVAAGNFRGDDMLPATIRALDRCAPVHKFTLDVFGRLDEQSQPWIDREYVRWMGEVSSEAVLSAFPAYDALIFTQLCPSCPNVLAEAVAAGLPVIAYDSGSVRELLDVNLDLLAAAGPELLQSNADFKPERLSECIERFLSDPGKYKAASAARMNEGARNSFEEYADLIETLASSKDK